MLASNAGIELSRASLRVSGTCGQGPTDHSVNFCIDNNYSEEESCSSELNKFNCPLILERGSEPRSTPCEAILYFCSIDGFFTDGLCNG